jgi:hypothetical protein
MADCYVATRFLSHASVSKKTDFSDYYTFEPVRVTGTSSVVRLDLARVDRLTSPQHGCAWEEFHLQLRSLSR